MPTGASADRLLKEAAEHPVRGWDFTWLGDRISIAPLPWSFEAIVSAHARRSPDLLDMETGGGEWLGALPHRPERTVATEPWPPNLEVAGARLRPLGITVVAAEAAPDNADQRPGETRGRLPFPAESFALVSNRHAAFVADEIARVLVPGGTFLTQQVGGSYDDFYDALELPRPTRSGPDWDLTLALRQLDAAGMRVTDSAQATEVTSFTDAGALAWYLKAIPWVIDGFSIDAHRSRLVRLQQRIQATGPVALRQPAFWLEAVKPDGTGVPRSG